MKLKLKIKNRSIYNILLYNLSTTQSITFAYNFFFPASTQKERWKCSDAYLIRADAEQRGRWSREAKPIFHEARSRRSLFLFSTLPPSSCTDGHPRNGALDDSGKKGGRREEILRSERNGVPVMGSPGISLKCRGLSIIRGQPLLHRASRSAGDEVRKERKEGGVRWKRTQAKRARSSPPLFFSFFLSLLFVFSFSLVSRTACPEEKKSPMEIRDFKGHAIPRSKLKKDRENVGKPGICTIVPSCRRFNFWTRWNLEKQIRFVRGKI